MPRKAKPCPSCRKTTPHNWKLCKAGITVDQIRQQRKERAAKRP